MVITNLLLEKISLELKAENHHSMNICLEAIDIQIVEDMRQPIEEYVLQIGIGRIASNSSLISHSQPIKLAKTMKEETSSPLSWYSLFPLERSERISTTSNLFKFVIIRRNPVPPLPEYGFEVYLRLLQLEISIYDKEVRWLLTALMDALADNASRNPSTRGSFSLYRVRKVKSDLKNPEYESSNQTEQSSDMIFNTFKADIRIEGPSILYKTHENGPRLEAILETIFVRADANLSQPNLAKDYPLCDERYVEFPSRVGDFNSIKPKMGTGIQITRILGAIAPIMIYYRHQPSNERELVLSCDEIPFAIDWDDTASPQFQCGLYVNNVK